MEGTRICDVDETILYDVPKHKGLNKLLVYSADAPGEPVTVVMECSLSKDFCPKREHPKLGRISQKEDDMLA
jgi:hypothetical protein